MHVVHRWGKSRTIKAANKLANLFANGKDVVVVDEELEPSVGFINGALA